MGSCCIHDDNVHYQTLQTDPYSNLPPKTVQPRTTNKNPDSTIALNQQSLTHLPESSLPSSTNKRLTYLRKTSSINQNAPHLAHYQHVHIVRPPSFIETSGQIAHFKDQQSIARLMNPNLNIRTSNQTYKPNLEWIREEPLTNY